jgi:hypothetical protein
MINTVTELYRTINMYYLYSSHFVSFRFSFLRPYLYYAGVLNVKNYLNMNEANNKREKEKERGQGGSQGEAIKKEK